MADEHRGGGAGEASDGVMLSKPVAGVAEGLGRASEFDGAGDSGAGGFTGLEANKVEYGYGEGLAFGNGLWGRWLRHTGWMSDNALRMRR